MNSCTQPAVMTVNPALCGPSTVWEGSPGNCRLRLAGYSDGAIPFCVGCGAGSGPIWDGTLSDFSISGNAWNYTSDPSFTEYDGMQAPVQAGYSLAAIYRTFVGTHWSLQLSCQAQPQNVPRAVWIGIRTDPSPVGIYTSTFDCSGVLPTLTVESYSL